MSFGTDLVVVFMANCLYERSVTEGGMFLWNNASNRPYIIFMKFKRKSRDYKRSSRRARFGLEPSNSYQPALSIESPATGSQLRFEQKTSLTLSFIDNL